MKDMPSLFSLSVDKFFFKLPVAVGAAKVSRWKLEMVSFLFHNFRQDVIFLFQRLVSLMEAENYDNIL